MLYSRDCKFCSQPVGIDSYPFNSSLDYQDDVAQALDVAMGEHLEICSGKAHLADRGADEGCAGT